MQAAPRPFDLLASASAIRVGYASRDWSRSSAGHPDTWGPVLRSSVGMILDSRFPMFIAWGPELVLLYNHAYIELLEAKHPEALGSPLRAVWPHQERWTLQADRHGPDWCRAGESGRFQRTRGGLERGYDTVQATRRRGRWTRHRPMRFPKPSWNLIAAIRMQGWCGCAKSALLQKC